MAGWLAALSSEDVELASAVHRKGLLCKKQREYNENTYKFSVFLGSMG